MNVALSKLLLKWKKKADSMHHQNNVLEAILYYTLNDVNKRFPPNRESLFYRLSNAVIKYVGGTPRKVLKDPDSRGFWWERRHRDHLEKELKKADFKLQPLIENAILKMTEQICNEEPFCGLYAFYRGVHKHLDENYSPSYEYLSHIKNKIVPRFNEKELENIKGIASYYYDI